MTDPILVTLSASIVKSAAKIWLKDHEFAGDTSATLIDIIRSRVRTRRDQVDVERIFQDIEFKLEESLVKAFPSEYRNLSKDDRAAVIQAARDAIDRANLDQDDLFASDLDPWFLLRHVTASSAAQVLRDLGDDELELYEDVLLEACTCIVETSRQLPGFVSGAFTELLRRQSALQNEQSSIAQNVQEILLRLPPTQAIVAMENDKGADEFERVYRRQLGGVLDTLRLFGVTVTTSKYDLRTAYVSISARTPSEAENVAGGRPIEELIATTDRIFIRAPAGYGKTTILQWIAVRSAYMEFRGDLEALNTGIPFYLPLRNYAHDSLPKLDDFVRRAGRHVGEGLPRGWVDRVLASGRGLVLIDGVDEVPEAQRGKVRTWLRQLVDDYPRSRFIVSSRPEATTDDWLAHEEFTTTHLLQLSEPAIKRFVKRWHAAAASALADSDERERIQSLADPLLVTIGLERHLRKIASVPLMCALLCALNRDGYDVRKSDRQEVYDAAINMLLELRDAGRGVDVEDIGLSRKEKIIFMRDLAYWLRRNRLVDVERSRAIKHLSVTSRNLIHVDASAEAIYKHLLHRSGLLQELTVEVMSFVHRTFQDYLTAQAMIEVDDLGALVGRAHETNWQEIVVMAVGYAGGPPKVRLLRGIIERSDTEAKYHRTLSLLAVACMSAATDLPKDLQRLIEQRAKKLVPPANMEEAAKLASAGPLVLEALEAKPPATSAQTAAAIRTARLIGGEDSLHYIARFKNEASPEVRSELVDAWSAFDASEYANIVLSEIREVTVTNPSLTPGLANLVGMEALSLSFADSIVDLSFVTRLPLLSLLNVECRGPIDLSPLLRGSIRLSSLGVVTNDLGYLNQLPLLPELRDLTLGKTYFGTDLRILEKCEHLALLTFLNDVDLGRLGRLRNLRIRVAGTAWRDRKVESANAVEIIQGGRLIARPVGVRASGLITTTARPRQGDSF